MINEHELAMSTAIMVAIAAMTLLIHFAATATG